MGTDMQIEYWNGAGAQRWMRFAPLLDRGLEPFGIAAMDALDLHLGQRVLDVGCGCGHSTLQLAERVGPSGYACGIDPSVPMVQYATTRAAGRPNVEFVVGDAQQHRFERPFDHVYSRFGVMFFEDFPRAFQTLREALVPGGSLAFVCWRETFRNPWTAFPLEWVRGVVPGGLPEPDPDAPGPGALADPDRTAERLTAAGFKDIELRAFETKVVFSTQGLDEAVTFASEAGPVARLLQNATDEVRERARAAIAHQLIHHLHDGVVALDGSAWIVRATT